MRKNTTKSLMKLSAMTGILLLGMEVDVAQASNFFGGADF